MTAAVPPSTLPRLPLIGIFGGLFFGYLGLTSVIPVLPSYVRDHYGASNILVGVVITATALTALLIRPVAGSMADKYGYRLVMGAGGLLVGGGAVLYFAPIGIVGLILVRLLIGVGEAALFTAGAVWVLSLTPRDRRGQLIGLYGVSMWGGISLGTLSGALLQHYGYNVVWAFSAIAPIVGLLMVSAVPAPARNEAPTVGRGRLLKPALTPGLALALGAAGYAGLASFIVLDLNSRGIHSGVAVLSVFSAVYAGTRLFIGRLPDRFGPRPVAVACGLSEAVGLLIIAVAPNLVIAIVGSVIMGVGFSLLHPSLALMVMNRIEGSQQGAALGAYTSFWDLGLTIWGPLTGVIATAFGYPAVFVAGAICAVAAAAMAYWIKQPAEPPAFAQPAPTRPESAQPVTSS